MKRPRGVGCLAAVMTYFGVMAMVGTLVVPWRPLPVAPQFLPVGELATRWVLLVTLVLYCVTALVCASALRHMRSHALSAYYAFVVALALYCSVFLFLIRVPKPLGIGILFFALLGAAVYWGWRVAKRASGAATDAL
jgi:hypothetical protein